MPSMAWEEIKVTYRKLQPQLKPLDLAKADKQIKLTKAALKKAWDAEEKFIEAFEAAKKTGLTGKKLKDFMGDPAFKKAHTALTKLAGEHATVVKALISDSEVAKKLDKPLTKLLGDMKKGIAKGDKEQTKFQKEVQEVEATAKKIAISIGKLTAAELLYGPQIVQVIDKIINNSKSVKALSGSAAKLVEVKELAKNLKNALGLKKKIGKLSVDAVKMAKKVPEAVESILENAQEAIDELAGIDKAYQQVLKKDAKLIKETKDSKESSTIEKAIKEINKTRDAAAKSFEMVKKSLEQAAKKQAT